MSVFIVIVVIVFLIACWSYEDDGTKVYNYEEEAKKSRTMRDSLVNEKFEEEIINKINNPEMREKILEIIQPDLEFIYGDAWKEIFGHRWFTAKPYCTAIDTPEHIVLTLMLSKSGLMPSCYKFENPTVTNYKISNAYECLKIIQCVEKNINGKKGWDEKLIFMPYVDRDYKNKHGKGTPKYDWPCSGKFYWSFERIYLQSGFGIDIRSSRLEENCKECSIGPRSLSSTPYKDKFIL